MDFSTTLNSARNDDREIFHFECCQMFPSDSGIIVGVDQTKTCEVLPFLGPFKLRKELTKFKSTNFQ